MKKETGTVVYKFYFIFLLFALTPEAPLFYILHNWILTNHIITDSNLQTFDIMYTENIDPRSKVWIKGVHRRLSSN